LAGCSVMLRGFITIIVLIMATVFCAPINAQTHDCSAPEARQNKRYASADVNLRSWPSTYADVLVTLPKGEIVYAYAETDGWSRVNVASLNITGYVATRYLKETCVAGGGLSRSTLSRASIVTILMAKSQSSYSGSCPCPNNVDRGARRCGARSAYSRPGGASPLCYPRDVTSDMIDRFISSR